MTEQHREQSMSFGYSRKRPRHLKNLVITEVSSVTQGAGRGVNVVLVKSHKLEDSLMPAMPINQAIELRKSARISDYAFAKLQEHFALEMFPQARTTGEALSRFYDTPRGRECLNASCAAKAIDLGLVGVDDYAKHAKSIGDGSAFPTRLQLDALAKFALLTALGRTPFHRAFQHLQPGERRTFSELVETWTMGIETTIRRRLSESERTQNAA